MRAQKETAQQCYDRNVAEALENIERIKAELLNRQDKWKPFNINWDHVGDVAHHNDEIKSVMDRIRGFDSK